MTDADGGYWLPCIFKGRKVFAEATAGGELRQREGRVAMVYRLGADKSYSTFPDRLQPVPGETPSRGDVPPAPAPAAKPGSGASTSRAVARPRASNGARRDSEILGGRTSDVEDPAAIHVWTDGACSGNPGPAGAGTIVLFHDRRIDIATFLGPSTNNVAELTAILVGLRQISKDESRTIVVHTDSQYSIGVLAKSWKAKANVALIERTRKLAERHANLVWHWVRGHEGVELNEAADALARSAVYTEASSRVETEREP